MRKSFKIMILSFTFCLACAVSTLNAQNLQQNSTCFQQMKRPDRKGPVSLDMMTLDGTLWIEDGIPGFSSAYVRNGGYRINSESCEVIYMFRLNFKIV